MSLAKRKLIVGSLSLIIGLGISFAKPHSISAHRVRSIQTTAVRSQNVNPLQKRMHQLKRKLYNYYYQMDYQNDIKRYQKGQMSQALKQARRTHNNLRKRYQQIRRIYKPVKQIHTTTDQTSPVTPAKQSYIKDTYAKRKWFIDGLNQSDLNARAWITWRESSDNWKAINQSSGCIGYFQLKPYYLGYHKNGSVKMNRRHQVKTADHYVATHYGSWVAAKQFWENNNWY